MITLTPIEAALASSALRGESQGLRNLIREFGERMGPAAVAVQGARAADMEALSERLATEAIKACKLAPELLDFAAQCGHGRVVGPHQCPLKAEVEHDTTTLCTCCKACEENCEVHV